MSVQPILVCSFCGKSHKDVAKRIAGPITFICNECVGLCREIIETEDREDGATSFAPRDATALRQLRLRCVELARNGDRDDPDCRELLGRAGKIAAFVLGDDHAGPLNPEPAR